MPRPGTPAMRTQLPKELVFQEILDFLNTGEILHCDQP